MKKSEILELLNVDGMSIDNVKHHRVIEDIDVMVVYVRVLTWEHLKVISKDVIDIMCGEMNDDTIRVSINNVEWD